MNKNILQLFEISCKPARKIIGLMSGTSLDGLDVALCTIEGSGTSTNVKLEQFETIAYDNNFKTAIKSIFSRHDADLEKVCLLNEWVATEHATIINQCLKKWQIPAYEVDIIASHGQTIYHAPKALHQHATYGNGTLQIGDGDHLAMHTGIITISDFRQKHLAAGGEGAPLAVYGDYLIFSNPQENRIMLNIGGIANFTFLPANLDATLVYSTDTGPGNTMMDAYIQQHFATLTYDKNGSIAAKGIVNEVLLKQLMQHPFFEQSFPKTTGPELFNLQYLENALLKVDSNKTLSHEDILATLNMFTARTIAKAIEQTQTTATNQFIYASGGGMHNTHLMNTLKNLLPTYTFNDTKALSIHPDAKEAVLFAVLANETLCGGNIQFAGVEKGIPSVSMGKISFPA